MSNEKIHFLWDSYKEIATNLAQRLTDHFGQCDIEDADLIVSIGGDGKLLEAFRLAANGQTLFGLTPINGQSRGFWTNHGIDTPEELIQAIETSARHSINPLKAELKFSDGSTKTLHAYNEFLPIRASGQALLTDLTIKSNAYSIGPVRIMGDGVIVANPLGSTAANRSYGGATIDIRSGGLSITGVGVYEPVGGIGPTVASDQTSFHFNFQSGAKRPIKIEYDSQTELSLPENPILSMVVTQDNDFAVDLHLKDDPASRAFATLVP